MCTLALVALPPDLLLLGGPDQLLAEIRVGDVDDRLGPLPGGQTRQPRNAVLRDDAGRLGARGGDDVAAGEVRDDVGVELAALVREGGMHGEEGSAVLGLHGAGDEVHLPAGAGDLAQTGRLAADLTEEIHGDAAVDGDEVVQLADGRGAVDIAHRGGDDLIVVVEEVIELTRAVTDGKHALAAVELFEFFPNFQCKLYRIGVIIM